jgi:hypothetical protein
MNQRETPSNTEIGYGYGDAASDGPSKKNVEVEVDYGYGDASPSSANIDIDDGKQDPKRSQMRVPRRSSMKQIGVPRRSSIGYSGEIHVQLPGRRDSVNRRTSITIEERNNEVKEVEPLLTLTNDPLWFKAEEYEMIRNKARLLTELAKSGDYKMLADNNLCTRGLESQIDSEAVYEQQYLAWKSVFLEQHIQRNMGHFDDEPMSKIYQMAASASQARAVHRARQDTAEAEIYTRSTRIMMRRLSM